MITHIKNKLFVDIESRNPSLEVSDIRFEQCEFRDCFMAFDVGTESLDARQRFRRLTFSNCTVRETWVKSAIVEDVVVDKARVIRELRCEACAYKHVTLRGKIHGMLWMIPYLMVARDRSREKAIRAALIQANAAYYKSVDWALDISQAEFTDMVIHGIPIHLIRRDPETQAIAKKAVVSARPEWRDDRAVAPEVQYAIERVVEEDFEEGLVIAPKASKHFREITNSIKALRRVGVLEPE